MKPRIDIEKIGVVSLWVLLAVWVVFLVKYALGLHLPAPVNTALIVSASRPASASSPGWPGTRGCCEGAMHWA